MEMAPDWNGEGVNDACTRLCSPLELPPGATAPHAPLKAGPAGMDIGGAGFPIFDLCCIVFQEHLVGHCEQDGLLGLSSRARLMFKALELPPTGN